MEFDNNSSACINQGKSLQEELMLSCKKMPYIGHSVFFSLMIYLYYFEY